MSIWSALLGDPRSFETARSIYDDEDQAPFTSALAGDIPPLPQQQAPARPLPRPSETPAEYLPPPEVAEAYANLNNLVEQYKRVAGWEPKLPFLPAAQEGKKQRLEELASQIQYEKVVADKKASIAEERWKAQMAYAKPTYEWAHSLLDAAGNQMKVPVVSAGGQNLQMENYGAPGELPPGTVTQRQRIAEAAQAHRDAMTRAEQQRTYQDEENAKQSARTLDREKQLRTWEHEQGYTPERAATIPPELQQQAKDADQDIDKYRTRIAKIEDDNARDNYLMKQPETSDDQRKRLGLEIDGARIQQRNLEAGLAEAQKRRMDLNKQILAYKSRTATAPSAPPAPQVPPAPAGPGSQMAPVEGPRQATPVQGGKGISPSGRPYYFRPVGGP